MRLPPRGKTAIVLTIALALGNGVIRADEIVLDDGTVVVGSVRRLKGNKLQVRTTNMGTIRIQRRPIVAFPSADDRAPVQRDGKLRIELVKNLDFDLTFYDRYDSNPPVATDEHDYGLTVGLGWSN